LYPEGCRLVEVAVGSRGAGTAAASEARVRSFASLEAADAATLGAQLASLRAERKLARAAWVTVWGLRSAQQFLRLPPANARDLEALAAREARKEIAPLEGDGDRATVGIMPGAEVMVGTQRRREVSMVAVSTTEVLRRIQPIVDAGFVVEGVLTPALALTAVARARRESLPGSAGAFVALGPRATCLAIVRDGILLFARELPWGYEADPSADAVGARLASELRRSVLFFKQTFRASVDYIGVCGDMPNLRALTAPLGEALSVPVQIGDSMTGIDAAAVPEPADRFRAALAALRLTIAAGSDAAPPINLLPASVRTGRESRAHAIRLSATVAASLGVVVAAYMFVGRTSSRYETEKAHIEQQLGTLAPEARRRDELRQAYAVTESQRTALAAFDSQGPRLTRLLEALSAATPDEIVLSSVKAEADGLVWKATVNGIAVTTDAASGQAAVNAMLRSLAQSPYAGAPVEPPSFRMVSGAGAAAGTFGDSTRAVPEGMSGVEFVLQLRLAR
jgi:Tfp pilus assembly protein PilN/Tfp pilus assembly PilM family ATPase